MARDRGDFTNLYSGWLGHVERMSEERVVKEGISDHCRRKWECRKAKVKVDGRREGGPEEDVCHKVEDTCTQKDGCHRLVDMCTQ